MTTTNYFALAVALISYVVVDGQAPSRSPTAQPTSQPSVPRTPAPSGPTRSPTRLPTRATQVQLTPGALAAAIIFSIIAGVAIILMFLYLFRAPKGSSPAQYYFPTYYAYYYPNRQHFVKDQPEIEEVEVVKDHRDDRDDSIKRDKKEIAESNVV